MRGGAAGVLRGRAGAPLFGLLVASIVGGCQYLFGSAPYPPDFGMPQPVAVYREGRATVTVDSDPIIVLENLSETGTFDPTFGAGATFHNADGWYVRVTGATKLVASSRRRPTSSSTGSSGPSIGRPPIRAAAS